MGWDKSVPTTSIVVSSSCEQIVLNWQAIQAFTIVEHGKIGASSEIHSAGECEVLQVETTAALRALTPVACACAWNTSLKDFFTWTSIASANRGGFVPSGTKMLFYQDTAPTGWTIVTTVDEKLVYITKGSTAGGESGGTICTSGNWTLTGFTGSANSHVLTEAELAAHYHSASEAQDTGSVAEPDQDPCVATIEVASYTGYTGGGGSHKHAFDTNMTLTGSTIGVIHYKNSPATYTTITTSAQDIDSIYFPTKLAGNVDFLYIGSQTKFNEILFVVGDTPVNTVATLSASYLSGGGGAWAGYTILSDGTSGSGAKPFSQSGTITLTTIPTSWALTAISGVSDLYWVRLSVDTTIIQDSNGDLLVPDYDSYQSAPWRPSSYCCIVCQKD